MPKQFATKVNSPQPYNVAGASREIGCSEATLRDYLKRGLIDGAQKTPAGHTILYPEQVAQARTIFQRGRRRE